jgi:hypothetical protein
MKFLAICKPREDSSRDAFLSMVPQEVAALRRLKSEAVLVEAWSPGAPGAVLIVEAPTESSAGDIVGQLPLAVAGLIDVDLTPLHELDL